jgi:hypothetical protein
MYKSVTRQQRKGEQSRLSTWPDVNVLKRKHRVCRNFEMTHVNMQGEKSTYGKGDEDEDLKTTCPYQITQTDGPQPGLSLKTVSELTNHYSPKILQLICLVLRAVNFGQ